MCARYSARADELDWSRWFELVRVNAERRPELAPELAPTDLVPIVARRSDGTRVLIAARWDLRPARGLATGRPLINVRIETAATKFADPFVRGRCVLPAAGFFEWGGASRDKYFVRDPERPLLTLAGLWTPATVDGVSLPTCAILTCEPSPIVAAIHDRMPVVLDDGAIDTWLDPRAPAERLTAFAQPWARLVAARV